MLRRKALRKIFITTMTVFILLVVYLIPTTNQSERELKTNLEVEYITGIGTNNIYLLNSDNFLVKTKILIDEEDSVLKIKKILANLTNSRNSTSPNGLKPLIPLNTKVLDVKLVEDTVTINFSKEFFNSDAKTEEKMIEAIVFSLTELENIQKVIIQVEGTRVVSMPNSKITLPDVLTRSIGINKVYDLDSRNGIQKVVVYYLDNIEGEDYYVPVTKYVNDSREKIKVIIDNLSSNYIYETNLMSYVNNNLKLLDYEVDDNVMVLNFNNYIFSNKGEILEEVVYTISSSIFDNYNVNEIVYRVNNEEICKKSLKDLDVMKKGANGC